MSTQTKSQDGPTSSHPPKPHPKSHELLASTVGAPSFAYAHVEAVREQAAGPETTDTLQFRSYLSAALGHFLGITGAAIPVDFLKTEGHECWVRVPRPDLGAFAAALTAWPGTRDQGVHTVLRLRQCSDWLGCVVGRDGQDQLWNS